MRERVALVGWLLTVVLLGVLRLCIVCGTRCSAGGVGAGRGDGAQLHSTAAPVHLCSRRIQQRRLLQKRSERGAKREGGRIGVCVWVCVCVCVCVCESNTGWRKKEMQNLQLHTHREIKGGNAVRPPLWGEKLPAATRCCCRLCPAICLLATHGDNAIAWLGSLNRLVGLRCCHRGGAWQGGLRCSGFPLFAGCGSTLPELINHALHGGAHGGIWHNVA